MPTFEKEQRQINALEFFFGYWNNMESWDKIYIELNAGKKPETDNALMRDALNRCWAFDCGKQAMGMAKGNLADNLYLMKVIYEYTGNPMFAFRGLKVCLDAGLLPPEWIANYMQEAITRLMGYAYRDTAGRPDDPLATAFNFRKGGGKGSGGTWLKAYNITLEKMADVLALMKKRVKTGETWKKAHIALIQEKGFKSSPPLALETLRKWRKAILDAL